MPSDCPAGDLWSVCCSACSIPESGSIRPVPPLLMGSISQNKDSPQVLLCLFVCCLEGLNLGVREWQIKTPPTRPPASTHPSPYTFSKRPGVFPVNSGPPSRQNSWHSKGSGRSKPLQNPLTTERVGFEPTEGFPSNDFESFAFDHSATSPADPAKPLSRRRQACLDRSSSYAAVSPRPWPGIHSGRWRANPAAGERPRGQGR